MDYFHCSASQATWHGPLTALFSRLAATMLGHVKSHVKQRQSFKGNQLLIETARKHRITATAGLLVEATTVICESKVKMVCSATLKCYFQSVGQEAICRSWDLVALCLTFWSLCACTTDRPFIPQAEYTGTRFGWKVNILATTGYIWHLVSMLVFGMLERQGVKDPDAHLLSASVFITNILKWLYYKSGMTSIEL